MLIVGITGNPGSGKTTVAGIFAKRGAEVIDADKITHSLLLYNIKIVKKLIESFGKDILDARGKIDRKKLAEVAFANRRNWMLLCKIVHPEIIKIIKEKIREASQRNIELLVVDAPLLFETGLDKIADYTVFVTAKSEQQFERAKRRLGISGKECKRRLSYLLPYKERIRKADFVLDNSKTIKFAERQVKKIWKRIISNQNK